MSVMKTPRDRSHVRQLTVVTEREIEQLSDVLIDCVAGGASVNFMHPLSREKAVAFWQRIAADAERGARILLVTEDDGGICGTVQIVLEQNENQPHRGDLSKMLVHRRARRRGLGAVLLKAGEDAARAAGKTLLVLDTATDEADRLYLRMGWIHAGTIPDYALLPHGGLCETRLYYRRLV